MRRGSFVIVITALITSLLAVSSPVAGATVHSGARDPYVDVPKGHFADSAVAYVAEERNWLRLGKEAFRPGRAVKRIQFARALVRAFAPLELADPTVALKDVTKRTAAYRWASVAVKRRWLRAPDGVFAPDAGVTKVEMDRALVRALELGNVVKGVNSIRSRDGRSFKRPGRLGITVVATQLRLHHNYPNEDGRELFAGTLVSRADAAYALHAAATAADGWYLWSMSRHAEGIVLPNMSDKRRAVVEFALRYTPSPYHYAGTSPGSGFDCSGFVWWVLKAGIGPASRGYVGWDLPDRTSYYMAKNAPVRIAYEDLRPGDIVTWDADGDYTRSWRGVNHAGMYLGNGWMIHSSGSRAGVTIDRMDSGYWRDRFVWGRRVI